MKLNDEIREICVMVHRRNELQDKRNHYRFKMCRFNNILNSKRNKNKLKEFEKRADIGRNPMYKAHREMMNLFYKNSSNMSGDTYSSLRNGLDQFRVDADHDSISAKKQLEDQGWKYKVDHPKKYDKIKLSEVRAEAQKNKAHYEMIKYEIMEYTNKTTKRLRNLLSKNGLRLRMDNGKIMAILGSDEYRLSRERIADIAADSIIDKEVLGV